MLSELSRKVLMLPVQSGAQDILCSLLRQGDFAGKAVQICGWVCKTGGSTSCESGKRTAPPAAGRQKWLSHVFAAIRFPNPGNHNNSFDRLDGLGVASSESSHIGSSRIFFLQLSRVRARCTQVPRGSAFGGVVLFKAGACGWRSVTLQRAGDCGVGGALASCSEN